MSLKTMNNKYRGSGVFFQTEWSRGFLVCGESVELIKSVLSDEFTFKNIGIGPDYNSSSMRVTLYAEPKGGE